MGKRLTYFENADGTIAIHLDGSLSPFGTIGPEDAGCMVLWIDKFGFWEAWILHELADKLDELNYAWDAQVARDLKELKDEQA